MPAVIAMIAMAAIGIVGLVAGLTRKQCSTCEHVKTCTHPDKGRRACMCYERIEQIRRMGY